MRKMRNFSNIIAHLYRIPHLGALTLLLGCCIFAGASVAQEWIDGTPYFFEHFTDLTPIDDIPSAPVQAAPQLAVGDPKSFFSIDFKTQQQYVVQATLRAIGEFCYIFVEDAQWGRTVNAGTVETIRRAFDDATPAHPGKGIYQIETEVFGPPPDIDGDPRIYLLLLDIRDGATFASGFVAGYFSPVNEQRGVLRHPELGVPVRSNELDMLYIDAHPLDAGSEDGLGVLAHEFQHLIHWRYDADEEVWVNEGCSDYAMFLCGYSVDSHVGPFERNPSISLVNWPNGTRSQLAHYGAAYLWMLYLHEQYGGAATISAVVKNRGNGMAGIESALLSRGVGQTFPAIFADWKVANALDDPQFAGGRYSYQNERLNLRFRREHRVYPVSVSDGALSNYGADYIVFSADGDAGLNLSFEGDARLAYDVKVVEFRNGRPAAVSNMPLTETSKGHLLIPNFEEAIFIPSLQPEQNTFGPAVSTYAYTARQGDKVEFRTSVVPNPVHPRYWEIIAIPDNPIGASAPLITVKDGNAPIVSNQPMLPVQDGAIYTHPLYLSTEIRPENVQWEITFFGETVGGGKLENE
jgi:hypothetical protein